MLIGEIYLPLERLLQYYGADLQGAHLPFNFQLLSTPWNARELARLVAEYERLLPSGAWPNWVLGNHDRPRIASRVGPAQARVAAMLLLTLRGTPTLYYGDELGMQNVPIPPEAVQDPFERRVPGLGLGRDPVRTPMQWSGAPHAGFSTARPWLPVSPDYATHNVAAQRDDPRSMLTLHKRLIALRQAEPSLQTGNFQILETKGDVLGYVRDNAFLIALNLGSRPQRLSLPRDGAVVLSTHLDRTQERIGTILDLRPDEGLIVRLVNGH